MALISECLSPTGVPSGGQSLFSQDLACGHVGVETIGEDGEEDVALFLVELGEELLEGGLWLAQVLREVTGAFFRNQSKVQGLSFFIMKRLCVEQVVAQRLFLEVINQGLAVAFVLPIFCDS